MSRAKTMPMQSGRPKARVSPKKRTTAVRHDSLDRHDTLALQREAVLDNYDTEIRARRALIAQQLVYALADLQRSCENEMAALPHVVASMTVGEFADKYSFNIDSAVRGLARQQTLEQRAREPVNERLERGLLASARKRKHGEALPTPHLLQGEPGSPLPSRPAKRTVPSSSKVVAVNPLGPATDHQAIRPLRHRAASPPTDSHYRGFVYRARPSSAGAPNSSVWSQRNAPKTPASTKERQPKQHESIQAFSLNGSPLGLLDVQRDSQIVEQSAAPQGDFTFMMPADIVTTWRNQLETVIMAPADRAKLEKMLSELM